MQRSTLNWLIMIFDKSDFVSRRKTNVAMLTVVSHLRDVGLIGPDFTESTDAGKKIVYIAPMKALAQEVVEKFSSKLKPLGMVVRELTGDMQLTRAAAEAANILVTTPEKWDGTCCIMIISVSW